MLTERVAGKIGMIIKRAAKVMAWDYDAKDAMPSLPGARPEGRKAGMGQWRGCQTAKPPSRQRRDLFRISLRRKGAKAQTILHIPGNGALLRIADAGLIQ
jgi:hypothetical protein